MSLNVALGYCVIENFVVILPSQSDKERKGNQATKQDHSTLKQKDYGRFKRQNGKVV